MSVGEHVMRTGGGASFDDQVFERLLRERIIFLGSEVNDEVTNRICAQLLLLASADSDKDIALYINSPGGSISAGMAVYDTMQYIKNDVATIAMGMAASMGQFLLCAGTPGKRYALPHASVPVSICPDTSAAPAANRPCGLLTATRRPANSSWWRAARR